MVRGPIVFARCSNEPAVWGLNPAVDDDFVSPSRGKGRRLTEGGVLLSVLHLVPEGGAVRAGVTTSTLQQPFEGRQRCEESNRHSCRMAGLDPQTNKSIFSNAVSHLNSPGRSRFHGHRGAGPTPGYSPGQLQICTRKRRTRRYLAGMYVGG